MGILDAPATDWRKKALATFDPSRDLPQMIAWWKFDRQLAGTTDGAGVVAAYDYSGLQQDLPYLGAQPTKQTDADGSPVARFAAGQAFYSSFFGNQYPVSKGYARPLVYAALIKPSSSQTSGFATVFGGNLSGRITMTVDWSTGAPFGFDSSNGQGGEGVCDGNWHVVIAVIDSGTVSTYIDGYYTGGFSGSTATAVLIGMSLGAAYDGTQQYVGDIREAIVSNGRMSDAQIHALGKYLASQAPAATTWPATFRGFTAVNFVDTTSSNGQAIRYFKPTRLSASPVLTIWCHPQAQNQQISPTYWGYPYTHLVLARGGYLVASAMHGNDSWGNPSSLADILDAYNKMVSLFGAFSKVVLVGASMGAQAIAQAVSKATLPAGKVKACYFVDGALSLAAMYAGGTYTASINTGYSITQGTLSSALATTGQTSLPTTASFPTVGTQLIVGADTANSEVVTTTGVSSGTAVAVTATTKTHASGEKVSDYPTKTAGSDALLLAASSYDAMPMRFTASAGDVTVDKTQNTDPFRTLVTGHASESALVAHTGAHLSGAALVADFDAYIDRVVGW